MNGRSLTAGDIAILAFLLDQGAHEYGEPQCKARLVSQSVQFSAWLESIRSASLVSTCRVDAFTFRSKSPIAYGHRVN